MKAGKHLKQMISLLLSVVLVITNLGTSAGAVHEADNNLVNFTISEDDLTAAIEEVIEQGGVPVSTEYFNFTDGEIDKYNTLFSDREEEAVYEFEASFESSDAEVQLHSFIRLPENLDEGYSLTGNEQIIFLYVNNSESTVRCSITITTADGESKTTKAVEVEAYQEAFEKEEKQGIDTNAGAPVTNEVPDTEAAEPETEESVVEETEDGQAEETEESTEESTQAEEEETVEESTQAEEEETAEESTQAEGEETAGEGTQAEEEETAGEGTQAETEETAEEGTQAEKEEASEEDTQAAEENNSEAVESSPQASISRHNAPVVAASLSSKDNGLVGIDGAATAVAITTTLEELGVEFEAMLFARGSNESFEIEDFLDAGYPKMEFRDSNGNVLDTMLNGDGEVVRKPSGQPLPRNMQFYIALSYGLKDSEYHDYEVQSGDTFTYTYPENLKITTNNFAVKDSSGEVIGTGIVEDGKLTITITKDGVGSQFRGTAGIFASVDWEKVGDTTELVEVNLGELEYDLRFPKVVVTETRKATVNKAVSDTKFNEETGAGHIKYDSVTNLPTAVRFEVTVTADSKNTGLLENISLLDTFTLADGTGSFDTESGVRIVSDSNSTVTSAEFEATGEDNQMRITLKDSQGNNASLVKGQVVKLSYWVKLNEDIWTSSLSGDSGSNFTTSTVKLNNTVAVSSGETPLSTKTANYNKTFKWFMKTGKVIKEYNDGTTVHKPAVEWDVFLNPGGANIGGWTVKDKLDSKQEYVGPVNVYAFKSVNDYLGASSLAGKLVGTADVSTENDVSIWTYTIPKDKATYYYVFVYHTKVLNPTDESTGNALSLANRIELTAPAGSGGSGIGLGGETGVEVEYDTYALTKDNAEAISENPGVATKWGWGEFGKIRWNSVISSYKNGEEEDAVITAGSTYTDNLSIVTNDDDKDEITALVDYHVFDADDEANLVLKDGDGNTLSQPDDYTVEFTDRSFTVTFNKNVAAPVTVTYTSTVTDFKALGNTDLLFENKAEFNFGVNLQRNDQAYHPFFSKDYLDKTYYSEDSATGIVRWKLVFNKGSKLDLGGHTVDIIEEIPDGMEFLELLHGSGKVPETGRDGKPAYEILPDNKVVIHLNNITTVNRNLSREETFYVRTKITDPNKNPFLNKATLQIDGKDLSESTAERSFHVSVFDKSSIYNATTAPFVKYTLTVNSQKAKLTKNPGDTLTVRDNLQADEMNYVDFINNVKVINKATGLEIPNVEKKIINSGRGFEITGLPDATHIEITYDVSLSANLNEQVNIKNAAQLIYPDSVPISTEDGKKVTIINPIATGEGVFKAKVVKMDQAGAPLEGAEFTLYKAVKEGGSWKAGEAIGTYNPAIEAGGNTARDIIGNNGENLQKDQIYYLEETTVPDGYTGAPGIFFAIFGSNLGDKPAGIKYYQSGQDIAFYNIKVTALAATKNLIGRNLADGEFTFEVYDGDTLISTGTNKTDGTIEFTPIDYSELTVGDHVFTVKELKESKTGVTYDSSVYTIEVKVGKTGDGRVYSEIGDIYLNGDKVTKIVFNNDYEKPVTGTSIGLTAEKILDGRKLKADEYTFDLYAEGNDIPLDTAKNAADGTIKFKTINYEKGQDGSYTYIVKERMETQPNVDYDRSVYTVKVDVTVDDSDAEVNKLVATKTVYKGESTSPAEAIVFTNTYTPPVFNDEIQFRANKELVGRVLTAEEFTFDVYEGDGEEPIDTATNNGEGIIEFKTITYGADDAGTHTYKIVERKGGKAHVTYDPTVYTVEVKVSKETRETETGDEIDIVAEITKMAKVNPDGDTPVDDIKFTNTYNHPVTDASIALKANKVLAGRTLAADEFTFDVYEGEGEDERLITSAANKADGTIEFAPITYDRDDVGTHVYRIAERLGSRANVTYDRTVYYVMVNVKEETVGSDSAPEIKVTAEITNTYLADETLVNGVVFNNRYTPPRTGGGGGGGTGGNVIITPGTVPLAQMPAPSPEPGTELIIIDGDVPLAGLPKTGDLGRSQNGIILLLGSLMLSIYMMLQKKKHE
ncbi:doubled motif LPXTG anchor domain-containing protein [Lacrimispora sp.]|uniref:doubled motif LPXTG anchor domain-containing protein n=1 Tax=Lacrimispora sp. TaxID=2719234 RepID=UPI002FDACE43